MYIHTQIAAGSELVSLEITKTIATLLILESVLVLLIPLTFVVMWPHGEGIMEISK